MFALLVFVENFVAMDFINLLFDHVSSFFMCSTNFMLIIPVTNADLFLVCPCTLKFDHLVFLPRLLITKEF